jgi:ABC-type sugar transport system ATPase subunit
LYESAGQSVRIPVNGETIRYQLPANLKQSLSAIQDGSELILGIRPEDVYIQTTPADDGFECQLVMMEALGSENIHHLQRGSLGIVSRTSPADVYPEGRTVWVTFESEGIRLFDRKTEVAI